jgi:hypothetical protein
MPEGSSRTRFSIMSGISPSSDAGDEEAPTLQRNTAIWFRHIPVTALFAAKIGSRTSATLDPASTNIFQQRAMATLLMINPASLLPTPQREFGIVGTALVEKINPVSLASSPPPSTAAVTTTVQC